MNTHAEPHLPVWLHCCDRSYNEADMSSRFNGNKAVETTTLSQHIARREQTLVERDYEVTTLRIQRDFATALCATTDLERMLNTILDTILYSPQEKHQEHIEHIRDIIYTSTNMLHRVTLHAQTERRLHQVQSLRTIEQAIIASLDLRLTLDILLDHVTAHLDVDAAAVLLFNPLTRILSHAASCGFQAAEIQHVCMRMGEGYAGRAAQERCIVSVPDVFQEGGCVRATLMAREGLTAYYGVPLIARGQVKGVLELFRYTPLMPDQEWLDFLQSLSRQAAIAIDNATLFEELDQKNRELTHAYDATLEGWVRALDMRDSETEGHTQRVTMLTEQLARKMGIGDDELAHIRRGALLHDIGKIAIPDSILRKPGPLTDEELEIMHRHPQYAYELLSPIPFLHPALDIPYCHHEKWDGTGYPRGLKGEQIPLKARIFAVVDVWDALLSDRPYRPGWSEENARDYISNQAGKHFDPQVVEVFLGMIDEGH